MCALKHGRRKMITDIKAVNIYGWVKDGEKNRWVITSYKIMFLRDGEWIEVRVEQLNPEPPNEMV